MQYKIDKHVKLGLIYSLALEKKKRHRGKKLNLIKEKIKQAKLFSFKIIRQARDFKVAKVANIKQEKKEKAIKKAKDKAKRVAKKVKEEVQKKMRKEEQERIIIKKRAIIVAKKQAIANKKAIKNRSPNKKGI
jgi:hypothetical protein